MKDIERRLENLEIQAAWLEDTVATLNDTVTKLHELVDLQQAQLRLLYRRLPEQDSTTRQFSAQDEIPPHY